MAPWQIFSNQMWRTHPFLSTKKTMAYKNPCLLFAIREMESLKSQRHWTMSIVSVISPPPSCFSIQAKQNMTLPFQSSSNGHNCDIAAFRVFSYRQYAGHLMLLLLQCSSLDVPSGKWLQCCCLGYDEISRDTPNSDVFKVDDICPFTFWAPTRKN